jgi:hypothetical protein
MYTSPELNAATIKLIYNARKNGKLLGQTTQTTPSRGALVWSDEQYI